MRSAKCVSLTKAYSNQHNRAFIYWYDIIYDREKNSYTYSCHLFRAIALAPHKWANLVANTHITCCLIIATSEMKFAYIFFPLYLSLMCVMCVLLPPKPLLSVQTGSERQDILVIIMKSINCILHHVSNSWARINGDRRSKKFKWGKVASVHQSYCMHSSSAQSPFSATAFFF